MLARDGVFLRGFEVYREIKRDGDPAKLAELPVESRDFLETIEDQIQAYAEVGRRWLGTTRQTRWLSDIHRQVVSDG